MEAGAATFMTFKGNCADLEELGDRAMITQIIRVGLLLLMFLVPTVGAKEWRGITPLKSTRADVERLLGKPNQLGRYEIQNADGSVRKMWSSFVVVDDKKTWKITAIRNMEPATGR